MSTTSKPDAPAYAVVPLTSEYPVPRVDLMPVEVLEGRRFRRARGWMVVAVVVTVAAIGTGYALAARDADVAADELAIELARTDELNAQAAEFAVVPATYASLERAETALQTAMVTDIPWYGYLSQVAADAPQGVWFTSITANVLAQPDAGTDPLAPTDSVADVVTTGRALTNQDVAAWMDGLQAIPGFDHVLLANATRNDELDQPFVDFQVSTKVLPEAYSDRYQSKAE